MIVNKQREDGLQGEMLTDLSYNFRRHEGSDLSMLGWVDKNKQDSRKHSNPWRNYHPNVDSLLKEPDQNHSGLLESECFQTSFSPLQFLSLLSLVTHTLQTKR